MEPSDPSVVARALDGDDDAFCQLVTLHQHDVYGYVLRLTADADAAWDVAQDVFVRAHRSLAQLRDAGSFRAWLFSIAVNRARDWLRQRRPVPVSSVAPDDPAEARPDASEVQDGSIWSSPERVHGAKEVGGMVAEAIESLSDTYREVAVLRFQFELSVAQIAAATGLDFAAAESRVRRAKAMLRKKLARKRVK